MQIARMSGYAMQRPTSRAASNAHFGKGNTAERFEINGRPAYARRRVAVSDSARAGYEAALLTNLKKLKDAFGSDLVVSSAWSPEGSISIKRPGQDMDAIVSIRRESGGDYRVRIKTEEARRDVARAIPKLVAFLQEHGFAQTNNAWIYSYPRPS